MRLYCATTNEGKLREFRLAAEGVGIEAAPGMRDIPPPVEDGRTFEENAILKAVYYSRRIEGLVFADDSGIEADALGGEPGVRSARFAGPGATDEENNRLLLDKLRGVKERGARYVCVAALAEGGNLLAVARGTVEGVIAESPRGTHGFGYDPLFYYPPFGCTFAETEPERKWTVSHRGEALRALLRKWRG